MSTFKQALCMALLLGLAAAKAAAAKPACEGSSPCLRWVTLGKEVCAKGKVAIAVGSSKMRLRAIAKLEKSGALDTAGRLRLGILYHEEAAKPFPRGLDFPQDRPKVTRKSVQAFKSWMGRRTKYLQLAEAEYRAVIAKEAIGTETRTAAARLGASLYLEYAVALERIPIPASVLKGQYAADARRAYCDAIGVQAEPLRKKGNLYLDGCIRTGGDGECSLAGELAPTNPAPSKPAGKK